MKRFFKFLGIIAGIFLLLFILAVVGIVIFVSPNRLKPILVAQVAKNTGRELNIDGDLAWTFFPRLSIKTGHMTLGNPAEFQQPLLAEIQEADISINVLPLLSNKIQSNGIILHGLKLNLIKNQRGQVNWNFIPVATNAVSSQTNSAMANTPGSVMSLAVAGIEITDGQVNWIDEQAKQSVSINDFELHAKNINFLAPFPFEMSFSFAKPSSAMKGKVHLNSDISLNMTKQIFALRSLNMTADLQQANQVFPLKIMGNVNVNLLAQTLQWSDVNLQSHNLLLTGNVNVTNLMKQPQTLGHLKIESFDLREWLKNCGQDVANIQMVKMVSGEIDLASVNNTPAVKGKLLIDNMEVNHVKLSHVNLPLQLQNHILSLTSITADLYQGKLQANTVINLTSSVPQISFDSKLTAIQIGALLNDLGHADQKIKFSGTANVDAQVTTAGFAAPEILKNLNGNAHFNVINGTLEGIDIRYYINVAKALLARQAPTASNTNKTEFASMTGSAIIKNGIVENNDLLVTSSLFTTHGKGVINLLNQQIRYQLDTFINKTAAIDDAGLIDITKIAIPVSITGSLTNPSIRMDSSSLTKAVADTVLQKAKDDLKNKVQKQLGGQGGALLQNLLGH